MNPVELKPGTYRLTRDLPALNLDRRVTRDWRCSDMKAGTLFYVVEATFDERPGKPVAWLEISSGHWGHQSVRADKEGCAELVAALEPIGEEPSTWLRREMHESHLSVGTRILDHLVATGALTLAQVQKAYEDMP